MAYPIYPGMDVKFMVETFFDDFRLTDDEFTIAVRDRYGRIVKDLRKSDLFWDPDGRFYFTLEGLRRGLYYAFFKGFYEDEDYDSQRATVTDQQLLLAVPSRVLDSGGKTEYINPGRCLCRHRVRYRVVTTVSVDGDDYLADCEGRYILTSDGKRICFKSEKAEQISDMGKVRLDKLTGEQFKRLIEGENPDGEIDTVPELMRAAQGIGDDETIKQKIDQEVAESDVERVSPEDLEGFEV